MKNNSTHQKFICPMHPEIIESLPGSCPICGMDLVPENEVSVHQQSDSFYPLIVIIGMILLVVAAVGINSWFNGHFNWSHVMMHFMAGFFLVFGGFKLLDLKGFVEAYATYDLIAKRVSSYGYIYPFIEISLGLLYLIGYQNWMLNIFTLILMTISGLGVLVTILKGQKFKCACLGTTLKLPLTKVTLIEDFGMAIMALGMLLR